MKVYIEDYWDIDRHGEGCDCGLCDPRGRSYGVAAVPLEAEEPVASVYAADRGEAVRRMQTICAEHGYQIVPNPDLVEEP